MIEFKSLKDIAYGLFYVYKLLGVLMMPLITVLYIISTAEILTSHMPTKDDPLNLWWAIIYAVCFEMNGLRLIIDAALEWKHDQKTAGVWDFSIGVSLVVLGTVTSFLEGMVETGAITDPNAFKSWMWLILGARSVAVVAMIIRECVHYAPLLENKLLQVQQTSSGNVTQIIVNQTNQTANLVPNQTSTELVEANQTVTELCSEPQQVLIPEKSSAGGKKQTIIELIEQNPGIKQTEIVRQTGFSKGYVSSVYKQLQGV